MDETQLRRLLGKPNPETVKRIQVKLEECEGLLPSELRAPTLPSHADLTLTFNLKGRTAGWARYPRTIALNIDLLYSNTEEIINQTVPHEYAHLVEWHLARHHAMDHNAHGPLWQYIMTKLGVPAKRTHNMETTPQRRTRKFSYSCPCGQPHNVGLNMHRKMLNGRAYHCTLCRGPLTYTGKEL